MIEQELLQVAIALAHEPKRGMLRQAYVRRSISTSYYALFHALARFCADELIGASKSKSAAWNHVYRALEHSFAKTALISLSRELSDPRVKMLSEAFVNLQQWRHDADYDPNQRYTLGFAEPCVVVAELAIATIGDLPADIRSRLATSLLLRTRRPPQS